MRIALLILVALPAACAAQTQELVLTAVQDAYVFSGSPDSNYSSESRLLVGKTTTSPMYLWRAYVQFDVSGVTGSVEAARLRMWQYSGAGAGYGDDSVVYRVPDPWDEETLTWSNQPAGGPACSEYEDLGGAIGSPHWVEWSVGEAVCGWVGGWAPNCGFRVRYAYEGGAGVAQYGCLRSSEYSDASLRPQLILSLYVPSSAARDTWGAIKAMYR